MTPAPSPFQSFPRARHRAMRLLIVAAILAPLPACAKSAPAKKAVSEARRLDTPTTIGGISCYGWVRTWDDGSLNQCRLAADTRFTSVTLPKDTVVWLYRGGKKPWRTWLSRNMTLQGVPCKGKIVKVGTDTCFYPSGKLMVTFLSKPATIQGVPCKKSGFCPVYLHENGKLKQCTLEKEAEVGGQRYAMDVTLHFDEEGKVIRTEKPLTRLRRLGGMMSGLIKHTRRKMAAIGKD